MKKVKSTSVSVKPTKISRTELVKKINAIGGRFFTSTHIGVDGKEHTMNCTKKKNSTTELGYIAVTSLTAKADARKTGTKDGGHRNINPQTLVSAKIDGVEYKCSTPSKKKATV